jgi:hypothetical protein
MNPFRWRPEHQVAGVIACLLGAIAGMFFAWTKSPFQELLLHHDYTDVFLSWLWYGHYWPWPLLGSVIAGLTFYAAQLLRTQN